MNVVDAINEAISLLDQGGVVEPRLEAASLAALALGRSKTFFIVHPEYELSPQEAAKYSSLVARRSDREPFQYIAGKQEFFGLDFAVGPGVLIPRPETELLVKNAIERLRHEKNPRFVEIGVGSGCIAVSMLSNLPTATAVGVDISPTALDYTRRNAGSHGVGDRLDLLISDLFSSIGTEKFDAVVSNPPYIPLNDVPTLQAEVRDFEPVQALIGGTDGLDIVRRIVADSPNFLKKGAFLAIEIGFGQSQSVKTLLEEHQWTNIEFIEDLQGIPRTVFAVRP